MKSSQEDIGLLEAYLKGRLSPEEKSALEVRLANEVDLNSDYSDLKVLLEGMRISVLENKLDMLKGLENSIPPVAPNENKNDSPPFFLSKKFWMAGIIIIFLAIFGWWIFKENKSHLSEESAPLFAEKFDREFILHSIERSADVLDSLTVEQKIAYDLYAIQEFEDAIPKLNQLWKIQNDTMAYFYMGISYLATGNTSEAEKILSDNAIISNAYLKQKADSILAEYKK